MKRISAFSMGGPLLGAQAYQAMVPQVRPLCQSGEFYLGIIGDFIIGTDKGSALDFSKRKRQ
jgi:hypothetical protein